MTLMDSTLVPNADALALFLATLNRQSAHHIGYCGEDAQEILAVLEEDFMSGGSLAERFTVLLDAEGCMRGALGFDVDEENRSAEVWGPFLNTEEDWERQAGLLWEQGIAKLAGQVDHYYGFVNEENVRSLAFFTKIGAVRRGTHHVLRIFKEQEFTGTSNVQEWSVGDRESFSHLHEQMFPGTYLSAKDILERLDEHHQLFVLKDENRLIGYVYGEGNPTFQEGSIEYLAVDPTYRQKGHGRALLERALRFLLHEIQLDELTLCVEASNDSAISLYLQAGFQPVHKLVLFELHTTAG
ncbi:GNAT family N-acetyltransferase [Gorillibacterium sp. CAU 1737]|uniref:GNAT family N-acetyltransferase n=1 Tax=Gorillibacterium sp. CAU 1737 TaxID=3140362 RepID=UPI0032619AB9